MGRSLFGRRHPRPAMDRTSRWAPLMPRSSLGDRLRAKAKSDVRGECKYRLDGEAPTTTAANETSRRLSEFYGLVCRPSRRSLRDEDIPGVPDLPGSPRVSAGRDQVTRQPSPGARSEKWTMEDYEIVKTLGEGSMGSVHMVKFSNGRGTVPYAALKIIDKGRVIGEHMVERVMQERLLVSRDSHPFVVRLFGTFQDDAPQRRRLVLSHAKLEV
ncbi:unnamed protein product [Prorocentrum cordatum]|uniref:Protein kinase domain-containing protein n=1 Tax=Prorocentrum cordatum TaxID=2364126 RepID=A0ABN9YDG8_9DINO|nr:unnamed protein product [Polarella glacialis]